MSNLVPGIYRAIVVDNKDPQNLRRVKVTVSQLTGVDKTDWVLPISATAKPPAIGQGVYIIHIGGDVEYPVWIGTFGTTSTTGGTGEGGGTNPPAGFFSYGAFHDETTQSAALNTATAIKLNKTDLSSGVTLEAGSKMKVTYAGVYNIQFSLQLHGLSGGGSGTTTQIWLRKNGLNVAQTNTKVSVNNNSPYVVAAWNFLIPINAGGNVQLMWATDNTQIKIESSSSSVGPNVPGAIVTVTQVA